VYTGLPHEDNDIEALNNEQRRETSIEAQAADGEGRDQVNQRAWQSVIKDAKKMVNR
jgi:hypothetical protein